MFVPAVGSTQTPIQWLLGALYLEVKRPMSEADYSLPSNSEIKNKLSCASILHYVIMCIETANLYFSYLYYSMSPPPLIYLDDEGSMFHWSVGIQLSDLDALDGSSLRTSEIIIVIHSFIHFTFHWSLQMWKCFISCTSFCVIIHFSENWLSLEAALCKLQVYWF